MTVIAQDVWRMWPFIFIILYAGLKSIDTEILNAAKIDGANMLQRFRYIVLPAMKSTIIISIILKTIESFKAFTEIYVMTGGGPGESTSILSMYIIKQLTQFNRYGFGSAVSMVLLFSAIIFSLVYGYTIKEENALKRLLKYIPLLIIFIFQLLPIYFILITSLKAPVDLLYDGTALVFTASTSEITPGVLFEDAFLIPVYTSLLVALGSTIISVALGSAAAFVLAKYKFKAKSTISLSILCLRMIPPVALALPLFFITQLGAIDSVFGLIIAHTSFNLPFAIWLMIPFYEGLPSEFSDAAKIDGLSDLKIFTKIYLPLSLPGIVVSSIFCFFTKLE